MPKDIKIQNSNTQHFFQEQNLELVTCQCRSAGEKEPNTMVVDAITEGIRKEYWGRFGVIVNALSSSRRDAKTFTTPKSITFSFPVRIVYFCIN